jgi:hypothetical protein
MKFDLGSELTYTATKDTTLILNIEAQQLRGQRILSEIFTVRPQARGGWSWGRAGTGSATRRRSRPIR